MHAWEVGAKPRGWGARAQPSLTTVENYAKMVTYLSFSFFDYNVGCFGDV
jgi:hypothetical protein